MANFRGPAWGGRRSSLHLFLFGRNNFFRVRHPSNSGSGAPHVFTRKTVRRNRFFFFPPSLFPRGPKCETCPEVLFFVGTRTKPLKRTLKRDKQRKKLVETHPRNSGSGGRRSSPTAWSFWLRFETHLGCFVWSLRETSISGNVSRGIWELWSEWNISVQNILKQRNSALVAYSPTPPIRSPKDAQICQKVHVRILERRPLNPFRNVAFWADFWYFYT